MLAPRVTRHATLFVLLLLLCRCATKHQPAEFPEFFYSKPDSHFDPAKIVEARELAAQEELGPYEKARLLDLTLNEMKGLGKHTDRYRDLKERVYQLRTEVRPLLDRWLDLQLLYFREIASDRKLRLSHPEAEPEGPYQEARKLWNDDRNEEASQKLRTWMRTPAFHRRTSPDQKVKAYYMRFRLALSQGSYVSAMESYEQMVRLGDCGWRTAQASFLAAILAHEYGDSRRALSIFEKRCDPDSSPERLLRDAYWEARFLERVDPAAAKSRFEAIASAQIPGYYNFLAQIRLGQPLQVDVSSHRRYQWAEFGISSVNHELLEEAERLLTYKLRPQAAFYLRQVASSLIESDGPATAEPLLYTASLFKAAGEHLEALRVYYHLASRIAAKPLSKERWFEVNFVAEMFPRPFPQQVSWLSKLWKVDADYVYSIMRQESAFSPTAVSHAQAQGLMQMMPFLSDGLSEQWGYQSYFHKRFMLTGEENLKLAIFHLYQLYSQAPHPALVAASYNAGLTRVNNWWARYGKFPLDTFTELIPIKETRQYVMLVLRNLVYYKILDTGRPVDPSVIPLKLPSKP